MRTKKEIVTAINRIYRRNSKINDEDVYGDTDEEISGYQLKEHNLNIIYWLRWVLNKKSRDATAKRCRLQSAQERK